MTENDRLRNVEETLIRHSEVFVKHGELLTDIRIKLGDLATQNNRMDVIEAQCGALMDKYDRLVDPTNGTITRITQWQASCPRAQMKALWAIVIPMSLALLGLAIKLVL